MTVGQIKEALKDVDDNKDVSLFFTLKVSKGDKLIKQNYTLGIQDIKTRFLEDEVVIVGDTDA